MKTGLVVEGGGMKCAYSAGILDKFLDDNITFSYCIGVSAGAREFDTLKSKKVPQSLEIGLFFCQIFIFII